MKNIELERLFDAVSEWCVRASRISWKAIKRFSAYLYMLTLRVVSVYLRKRAARSAAQMSFHIIFSIFPLLICLNWFAGLLHVNYENTITFLSELMPTQTVSVVVV